MTELSNFQQEKNVYLWVLAKGIDLNFGKLSIADLRNYRHSTLKNNRFYQVHCDDSKLPWSAIYDNPSSAVNKFMELKGKLRKPRHLV